VHSVQGVVVEAGRLESARRLVAGLAGRPRSVGPYLRQSVFARGRSPLTLGLPWLPYAAIDFLERHLDPSAEVFEWGSGGSTLFLAQRCRSVVSVEHDPGWHAQVAAALEQACIGNVDLRLEPFDFEGDEGFAGSGYLHAVEAGSWDAILVDGHDWSFTHRPLCFAVAETRIREGGFILVDDAWRYGALRSRSRASAILRLAGVGPGRLGPTSSDVHLYARGGPRPEAEAPS
jgi:hypothetical protein